LRPREFGAADSKHDDDVDRFPARTELRLHDHTAGQISQGFVEPGGCIKDGDRVTFLDAELLRQWRSQISGQTAQPFHRGGWRINCVAVVVLGSTQGAGVGDWRRHTLDEDID
jgi:hypothetical protein